MISPECPLFQQIIFFYIFCEGLNGKLEYTITGGDEKNQFVIDENGTIFTRAPLDREGQSFYNLVVRASDLTEPPHTRLSSTVQVRCRLIFKPYFPLLLISFTLFTFPSASYWTFKGELLNRHPAIFKVVNIDHQQVRCLLHQRNRPLCFFLDPPANY